MSRIVVTSAFCLLGLIATGCQQQGAGDSQAKAKPAQTMKIGTTATGKCTYGLMWLFDGVRKEAQMLQLLEKTGAESGQITLQKQVLGRACFLLMKDHAQTVCLGRFDYTLEEQEVHVELLKPICEPLLKSFESSAPVLGPSVRSKTTTEASPNSGEVMSL